MTTKIRGRWQQIQLHSGPVHYYDSVAQLPYLVLDESACGPGQLVHAPDAGHVLAVDAGGVGGAGVFAHKDGGDSQTLPLQRPHLGGGVLHARAAAVVALDPRSGAVRAMVSRPGYDPNLFVQGISSKDWNKINNDDSYPLNNKVISGEYPPGSTFKIVTGSAAFELNKVRLDESIYDGGFHPLVPTMGNAGGEVLGWLTFIKALAMSDNVYFYELGYRVGIDNISKYARIYGFGQPTGIDLEGESKGLVASKQVKRDIWDEDWRLGDTFNAAIGQGFNLTTPIQLAVMLGIVANGGMKYQPYLVDSITNPDGSLFAKPKRAEGKHIDVSQQTIDYMRMGMSATTQEGGTASYFSRLPKPIAGKTGTAENSHGRDHGLFVAYGPVDDPELVVVCIVEQGGFGSTGK